MTTYSAILDTEVDADSPVTSTLMDRLRLNPIAMAEGAANAPVVATGWHPYNKVLVGDSNDGTIYDFAVDGGLATIETPDFEDGYEYALWGEGFTSNLPINTALYLETSGIYSLGVELIPVSNDTKGFFVEYRNPRLTSRAHVIAFLGGYDTGVGGIDGALTANYNATAQKILRARIASGGAAYTGGVIKMWRRRDYTSG